MYQVISVRVLRQALAWMGIPAPLFRTTDFMRWPDGRLTSTVKCMWNYSEIAEWYEALVAEWPSAYGSWDKDDMAAVLYFQLQQAFAEDIQIVTCRYEHGSHWFVAYLTCTIRPHDTVLDSPFNNPYEDAKPGVL